MAVHAQAASDGHDADTVEVVSEGLTGLDEAEAQRRLARHGPNAVAGTRSRGLIEIVRGILREPMFLLLLAAAGLYLVIGDIGEGLFMTADAVVTIANDPAYQAKFRATGFEPLGLDAIETERMYRDEVAAWSAFIRERGLTDKAK